jgi:thiosulfate/3-mercaptopyruvate sulfurtransferase
MTRTISSRIRRPLIAVLGLLYLVLLSLSACTTEEIVLTVVPTSTPQAVIPTEPPAPTPRPTLRVFTFPLSAPAHVTVGQADDETCVGCHTDKQALQASLDGSVSSEGQPPGGQEWAAGPGASAGPEWSAAPIQVEAWEKALLNEPEFFETLHGRYGCIACHGGTGSSSFKETAHEGLIEEPSVEGVCGDCHAEEVATDSVSLHTNLVGHYTVLAARSAPNLMGRLEEMLATHCDSCHTTTCGQCHVTRPDSLGGGLVAGHLFQAAPATDETCAGCHGSRIDVEYKGHDSSVPPDIHWQQAGMTCFDCHSPLEMHGSLGEFLHRYDGPPTPTCQQEGCHPGVNERDGIAQHDEAHLEALSCQVCHSMPYRNCFGCHVTVEDGIPSFDTEPPQMLFKIGLNPLQSSERPWAYVPVRHVPIERDSFAYYGTNLLPNFDAQPTWKFSTPHNIQRITPQSASCNACHGNADCYLTPEDISAEEWEANLNVVVETIPEPVEEEAGD